MQAVVIKWFTDKETLIPYSEGRIIEVSNERFEELSAKGFVDFAPEEQKKTNKKKK